MEPSLYPRFVIATLFFLSTAVCRAQNTDGTKSKAAEFVGKWCFISSSATSADQRSGSCITLNSDGTYSIEIDRTMAGSISFLKEGMNSDEGTWWMIGNTLRYKSDSQGEGSFRFQKATHPQMPELPVLMVNGALFAPAGPHDPW